MQAERNPHMNTSSVEHLLTLWKQEAITAEQAIGHLLQHIALLYERLRTLEKREKAEQKNHEAQK
jgi:hypothetical protein